ncbi:MAG: Malonyl CoA-acyl carrier protein transacylase, partial [uncultured Solirubrobacteraceae bacterium]
GWDGAEHSTALPGAGQPLRWHARVLRRASAPAARHRAARLRSVPQPCRGHPLTAARAVSVLHGAVGVARARRGRSARRRRPLARRVRRADGGRRDRLRRRRPARRRPSARDGRRRGAPARRHGRAARRRARRRARARGAAAALARQRQRARPDRPVGPDGGGRRSAAARRRHRLSRAQARRRGRVSLAADGAGGGPARRRPRRHADARARVPRALQRQYAPVRGHPRRARREPAQARALARDPARAAGARSDGLRRVRAGLRAQGPREANAQGGGV